MVGPSARPACEASRGPRKASSGPEEASRGSGRMRRRRYDGDSHGADEPRLRIPGSAHMTAPLRRPRAVGRRGQAKPDARARAAMKAATTVPTRRPAGYLKDDARPDRSYWCDVERRIPLGIDDDKTLTAASVARIAGPTVRGSRARAGRRSMPDEHRQACDGPRRAHETAGSQLGAHRSPDQARRVEGDARSIDASRRCCLRAVSEAEGGPRRPLAMIPRPGLGRRRPR
jgi:hypothetical protein